MTIFKPSKKNKTNNERIQGQKYLCKTINIKKYNNFNKLKKDKTKNQEWK